MALLCSRSEAIADFLIKKAGEAGIEEAEGVAADPQAFESQWMATGLIGATLGRASGIETQPLKYVDGVLIVVAGRAVREGKRCRLGSSGFGDALARTDYLVLLSGRCEGREDRVGDGVGTKFDAASHHLVHLLPAHGPGRGSQVETELTQGRQGLLASLWWQVFETTDDGFDRARGGDRPNSQPVSQHSSQIGFDLRRRLLDRRERSSGNVEPQLVTVEKAGGEEDGCGYTFVTQDRPGSFVVAGISVVEGDDRQVSVELACLQLLVGWRQGREAEAALEMAQVATETCRRDGAFVLVIFVDVVVFEDVEAKIAAAMPLPSNDV